MLAELLKHTEKTSPEYPLLEKALETIKLVAEHVNERMKDDEKQKKMVEIVNSLTGLSDDQKDKLVAPNRWYITEGEIEYREKKNYTQRLLYLFNNMVLIAKKRKKDIVYVTHFNLNVSRIFTKQN